MLFFVFSVFPVFLFFSFCKLFEQVLQIPSLLENGFIYNIFLVHCFVQFCQWLLSGLTMYMTFHSLLGSGFMTTS